MYSLTCNSIQLCLLFCISIVPASYSALCRCVCVCVFGKGLSDFHMASIFCNTLLTWLTSPPPKTAIHSVSDTWPTALIKYLIIYASLIAAASCHYYVSRVVVRNMIKERNPLALYRVILNFVMNYWTFLNLRILVISIKVHLSNVLHFPENLLIAPRKRRFIFTPLGNL